MGDTRSNTIVLSRPQGPTPSEWQTSPTLETRRSRSASPVQDDQRSSSLSDFDGELDEPSAQPMDDNDASSQVAGTENESEAETERLQDTPKANSRFVNPTTGLTPSKLKQETAYDDSSDSQATPTNARSRTTSVAGRKRKRPSPMSSRDSPLSDASDSDRALAKRRHAQAIEAPTATAADSTAERDTRPNGVKQPLRDEPGPESPSLLDHKMRGRSRSRRARTTQDPVPLVEEPPVQVAEAVDQEVDDEEEEDDDADSSEALTAEDVEKQAQAAKAFDAIAKQFQLWRVKCQDEKIAAAETELAELDEPDPAHIEYIRQMQCITARRDTRMRQDTRLHQYKRQALRIETIAHRSQLLSQYYQEARDIREDLLYKLGKEWYVVQKERRIAQAEELDRYTYVYPSNRSEQLRQQARYNTEVSILAGIAKYIGFPAAPDLKGARPAELQDDLKAMKVTMKHAVSHATKKPHDAQRARNAAQKSEQLAQKEFIEQTPWANPRHAVHRTPSAFGPNGFDASRVSTLQTAGSNAGYGQRTMVAHASSPAYSTPVHSAGGPFKADHDVRMGGGGGGGSLAMEHEGSYSDGPSSIVTGPPQNPNGKPHSAAAQTAGDGSPIARSKKRTLASIKHDGPGLDAGLSGVGAGGGGGGGGNGKRDFSGVSSTSTIDAPPPPDPDPDLDPGSGLGHRDARRQPDLNGSAPYEGVDGGATRYGPAGYSGPRVMGARAAV